MPERRRVSLDDQPSPPPCHRRSITVPAHWPTEVSNGLLMATRRERISEGRAALFWDELAILPIPIESALTPTQAKSALALCDQHRLTIYDAVYLELAKRKAFPLATLDDVLIRAAISEAVSLTS